MSAPWLQKTRMNSTVHTQNCNPIWTLIFSIQGELTEPRGILCQIGPLALNLSRAEPAMWAMEAHSGSAERPIVCERAYGASQTSSGTLLTIQIGGINLPGTQHSTSIWGYICRSLVPFLSPQAHWAVHGKSQCPSITLLKNNYYCDYTLKGNMRQKGEDFNFVPSRVSLFRLCPLIMKVLVDM